MAINNDVNNDDNYDDKKLRVKLYAILPTPSN